MYWLYCWLLILKPMLVVRGGRHNEIYPWTRISWIVIEIHFSVGLSSVFPFHYIFRSSDFLMGLISCNSTNTIISIQELLPGLHSWHSFYIYFPTWCLMHRVIFFPNPLQFSVFVFLVFFSNGQFRYLSKRHLFCLFKYKEWFYPMWIFSQSYFNCYMYHHVPWS